MRLLVSMGIRPGGTPTEPLRPRLIEVDADTGAVLRALDHRSPVDVMSGPDVDQEMTCAAWRGDILLQPTLTEILEVSVSRWSVLRSFGHPRMHSVHNVAVRPGGGLVVSCAGTDSVLELDDDGALLAHHWLRRREGASPSGDFEAAYPGVIDFRRAHLDRFRPHSHHPNHAFFVGDELWVTCFETRECRSLSRPERRVRFPEGIPHDGRLIDGLMWFTLVQGHVIAVDPETLERRLHLDLGALDGRPQMPGWCRGVEVVGSRLFVGMSMLRRTRHREVLRLLVRGIRGAKLPTRIVEIDLERPRIVREIEVGNAAGGTIYGILAAR